MTCEEVPVFGRAVVGDRRRGSLGRSLRETRRARGTLRVVGPAQEWRQSLTQLSQCAAHIRFDRLHRHPELLGDLAVLEIALAAHEEDFTRARRQVGDCVPNGPLQLIGLGVGVSLLGGPAEEHEQDEERTASSIDTSALDADVDAILDEIDEVLEENAEDFVKSFVQKGGQ